MAWATVCAGGRAGGRACGQAASAGAMLPVVESTLAGGLPALPTCAPLATLPTSLLEMLGEACSCIQEEEGEEERGADPLSETAGCRSLCMHCKA